MYIQFLAFTALFLGCSANIASHSKTTLTVDYFGIHESTSGHGWDNPLNVERLFLGNSRPLTVIFADLEDAETEVLINQVLAEGFKNKVWIIDSRNATSQLIRVLMRRDSTRVPSLIHVNPHDQTLERVGRKAIITFLSKYSYLLDDITDKQYYD